MFLYLILFLVLYAVTNHFLNKSRNLPPTPFPSLPILGHLHLIKKPLHRSLANLSAKHGPIFLLQLGTRPVLVVSSPPLAEECFTKNDVSFANRPHLLSGKILGYNFTSLGWAPYGDHWRNLRKISSLEILSFHRLQLLSAIRSDEVKLLLRRLYRNDHEAAAEDMKVALFELTMNVMMRMISGKRYFRENVVEVEEVRAFREIVTGMSRLSSASNLPDFLPLVGRISGLEKKLVALHKEGDGFIQNLIEEYRSGKKGSADLGSKSMIQVLLSLQESEPENYKDITIKGLMMVLLAAGTDTSAGTVEWAMSLLLNNPQALKKAQHEIDSVIGHDRLITESDLANLPYLHCIMNETLRMYPAGPLLVPHESSTECSVGGYRVPRGTMLLVNAWGMHNDPKIWKDAAEFVPERFQDLAGSRDGFRFMPFGSGRRGCPGEGLALRIVGLALGSLLQCFEWGRVGKEMVDMTEGSGLTLPKAQPLLAKCSPRPSMVKLLAQI